MAKKDEPAVLAGTDEALESSVDTEAEGTQGDDDSLPTAPVNKGDEELRMEAIASAVSEEGGTYLPPVAGTYVRPSVSKKSAETNKKHIARFAKLAHVDVEDVIGWNPQTNTGVTAQGGKYQMNTKGTQIRVLAGPVPEGMVTETQAAEQARLEKEANAE